SEVWHHIRCCILITTCGDVSVLVISSCNRVAIAWTGVGDIANVPSSHVSEVETFHYKLNLTFTSHELTHFRLVTFTVFAHAGHTCAVTYLVDRIVNRFIEFVQFDFRLSVSQQHFRITHKGYVTGLRVNRFLRFITELSPDITQTSIYKAGPGSSAVDISVYAVFPLPSVEVIELGCGVETFEYETDASSIGTCSITLYCITMHPKGHFEPWIAVFGRVFRVVQRGLVDTFTVDTFISIGQELRRVTTGLTVVTGNLSETDIVEVSGSLVGIH